MATTVHHETARIYQFRPRATKKVLGYHEAMRAEADRRLEALPAVEFGGGWYHEEAVKEADRAPKP